MKLIFTLFIALFFLSCNNSGKNGADSTIFGSVYPPIVCNDNTEKKFVYDLMHDSYLWSEDTKVLTEQELFSFESDESVLNELKYSGDKYSYILTQKEYDDFFQAGVSSGFGFFPSLVRGENDTLFVNIDFVYPKSPADIVGLKRGDLIEFVDGYTINQILDSNELLEKYFGNTISDLTMELKLIDLRILVISKQEYDIKTVLHQSIQEVDGKKVGYLVFQSFITPAYEELSQSFEYFKSQNIDELVLDLRYNGGGYIDIANYLSSLIGGDKVAGEIFNKTLFNQKYSEYNTVEYFKNGLSNALNLFRVFVITTESSCSASELVINSLRSSDNRVDVVQIGSKTCGKPYGMIGGAYCDKYIMPVQMKSANGDDEGDYIDGLIPTCLSIDDISRDFGDVTESSLLSALYFIENGECRKTSRSNISNRENLVKGFKQIYGLY